MELGTICLKNLSEKNIQVEDKRFSNYKNVDKELSVNNAFLEYWILEYITFKIYIMSLILYTHSLTMQLRIGLLSQGQVYGV